ncbi:hypothetical protein EMCRGX_G029334 [Ephydatia muelleri]
MIAIVWSLIIVSVVSPYFPRGNKATVVQSTSDFDVYLNDTLKEMDINTTANQSTTFSTIKCSDAFFANNGVCLPRCDKWKQYPEDISKAVDAIVITSSAARVVFGTIALVASCVNWRKMFAFPAVLIIHMNVAVMSLAIPTLVSISDRSALFCSSLSLFDAMNKPTPFCSFSAIYYYFVLHNCFCWFCHVTTLFWQIMFPFHARTCKITCVMTGIGTSLLIITIAELIKRRGVREQIMKLSSVGITADKKIFIVLCYFVCFCSAYFAASSVNSNVNVELASHIKTYFACEANGYNSNRTCNAEKMAYEALTYPGIKLPKAKLASRIKNTEELYRDKFSSFNPIQSQGSKWWKGQYETVGILGDISTTTLYQSETLKDQGGDRSQVVEQPGTMKKHGEVKQTEVVLCQAKLKIGRISCIDGLQFCYTDPFGGLVTAKLLPLKLRGTR